MSFLNELYGLVSIIEMENDRIGYIQCPDNWVLWIDNEPVMSLFVSHCVKVNVSSSLNLHLTANELKRQDKSVR